MPLITIIRCCRWYPESRTLEYVRADGSVAFIQHVHPCQSYSSDVQRNQVSAWVERGELPANYASRTPFGC